jgi:hypothetical protein
MKYPETGTPTFLIYQLKKTNYPLEMITREELTADTLNSIEIMDENPLPWLYQSGYLTIKGYDKEFKTYTLGFPNHGVKEGLENGYSNYIANKTVRQGL